MENTEFTQEVMLFNEFAPKQLYRVLQLRSEVFVVEQTCHYQDLDGLDLLPETRHLLISEGLKIVGYSRILAPGASYSGFSSIGRIVTPEEYRGRGLGHKVVAESVKLCDELWPNYPIKIGAQAHLTKFYEGYGFKVVGEVYIEDGIPHVHMDRRND